MTAHAGPAEPHGFHLHRATLPTLDAIGAWMLDVLRHPENPSVRNRVRPRRSITAARAGAALPAGVGGQRGPLDQPHHVAGQSFRDQLGRDLVDAIRKANNRATAQARQRNRTGRKR